MKENDLYKINRLLKIYADNQKELSKFIKDVKIDSLKRDLIFKKQEYRRFINYLHYKKNILENKKPSHKKYHNEYNVSLYEKKDLKNFQILYDLYLYEKNDMYVLSTDVSYYIKNNMIYGKYRLTLNELKEYYFLIERHFLLISKEISEEKENIKIKKDQVDIIKKNIDKEYSPKLKKIYNDYNKLKEILNVEKKKKLNNSNEVIELNKLKKTFKDNNDYRKKELISLNENIKLNMLRIKKYKNIINK